MKTCTKCKIEKLLTDFGPNKQMRDGRASWCRSCQRVAAKACEQRKPDQYRERKTRWRNDNPDKAEEATKKWRAANPDRPKELYAQDNSARKNSMHKRRAAKMLAENTLTVVEWNEILEDFNHLCFWCGAPWQEQDHLIPISKGGGHTAANVVPSCLPCNRKKKDKDPLEFLLKISEKEIYGLSRS